MGVEIKLARNPLEGQQFESPDERFVAPQLLVSLIERSQAPALEKEFATSGFLTLLNHDGGLTQKEMGIIFGRSQATISRWCQEKEVKTRGKRSPGKREVLEALYKRLGSQERVGKELGRSQTWVYREMARLNLSPLPAGRRPGSGKVPARMVEQFVDLYKEGLSLREIEARFRREFSRETIRQCLLDKRVLRERTTALSLYFDSLRSR